MSGSTTSTTRSVTAPATRPISPFWGARTVPSTIELLLSGATVPRGGVTGVTRIG